MPLFTRELNELADYIGRSDLTIWLHTAAPTNASPRNGRTTLGGGAYAAGKVLRGADITTADNGDIKNKVIIAFGVASEDVGTATHWSATRGNDAVAYDTLPVTIIAAGDSFNINANSLVLNGSTP